MRHGEGGGLSSDCQLIPMPWHATRHGPLTGRKMQLDDELCGRLTLPWLLMRKCTGTADSPLFSVTALLSQRAIGCEYSP